jgi:flagellar motor switch protein FliN
MTNPPTSAARPADLEPLGDGAAGPTGGGRLDSLLDMALPVTIEFGRTTLTMQELLDLTPGAVVVLDRMVGEPVDIYVSDRRLAEGEVVVVGERLGVRLTRVLPPPRDAANGGR